MKYILPFLLIFSLVLGTFTSPAAAFQGPGNPEDPQAPHIMYLPLISPRGGTYAITGTVTDSNNQKVAGAMIADQYGHTAITDAQGRYNLSSLKAGTYSIAPQKQGYLFTPSLKDVTVGASVASMDFKAVAMCKEGVKNGGFESVTTDWAFSTAAFPNAPASRVTTKAHSGEVSALTGVLPGSTPSEGYSFITQKIAVPADASGATLRMFIWPISDEAPAGKTRQPNYNPATFPEQLAATSSQYVIVLDGAGKILKQSMSDLKNKSGWTLTEFNIFTPTMKGQTITLMIGTQNTKTSHTAMYVDDVTLDLCSGSYTPTTPQQPAAPTAQLLTNPDYEASTGWFIPATEWSAGYTTAINHTTGGTRSMRTGITNSVNNRYSYSDAYQIVSIPFDAEVATLDMWIYPQATSAYSKKPLPAAPLEGAKFTPDAALSTDVQYVLVLDPYGYILRVLLWQNSDARLWQEVAFDLTAFRGDTIRIQYGTANDGWDGISSMFVDDTTLNYTAAAATATPVPTTAVPTTAVPTTAVPTTPAATVTVPACRELIGEGGFETYASSLYWGIPVTSFSANWASKQRHAGVYAMRAGIPNAAHNRYSYSDFFQDVYVPYNATAAVLQFYEYPIANSYTAWNAPAEANYYYYGDVQYLLVLDWYGNWIDTLMWENRNDQVWLQRQVDLTYYAGDWIRLQWGVYNDGYDGVTSMYIDDVTFGVCP